MGRLQTFAAHTYPKLAVVVPTPQSRKKSRFKSRKKSRKKARKKSGKKSRKKSGKKSRKKSEKKLKGEKKVVTEKIERKI